MTIQTKKRKNTIGGQKADRDHQAWRPSNPWHPHYLTLAARHGKNPAKSAVARKLLIAAQHTLSRQKPFKPNARTVAPNNLPRPTPVAS